MRYLKPKARIEINREAYDIIYSLDVIDEIQDKTGMSIIEVIMLLYSEKHRKAAAEVLLRYLTGKEITIKDDDLDYYSDMLIKIFIEQIKYKDMPKPKKDDDNNNEYQFVDIEGLYYIGKIVLGFNSDEVWKMTIGQIKTLLNEHNKYMSKEEDKVYNVDDVIPY